MDKNEKNKKNKKEKDFFIKILQTIGTPNNDISFANKIFPFFYRYCNKLMELFLDNRINSRKLVKKRQRNINYIIKNYFNKIIENNNNKNLVSKAGHLQNAIFIHFFIFYYSLFKEARIYKTSEKYFHKKNRMLFELNELLSKMIIIFGKLYCNKTIDDDKFEIFLKFLIILSISKKEIVIKNDILANTMFLKECINIIKKVYKKIYETQNEYTEKQEKIINNIILFIRENIIDYSNNKPINIINKSFLSNNDYYTTSIIDIIFIISKMKKVEITDNLIELLANIYSFSFKYENMMNSIIKILEPLLINLNIKKFEVINSELNISNFPIKLLNKLDEKEEMILKEDPTFLKKGFYLGNKVCGICGEIDDLKEDFMLIFGFSLQEINNQIHNIKEWTLINIRNDKNESKLKISLLEIENIKNQYNLIIKTSKKSYKTQIIVLSKKTYIFSFNVTSSFKGTNLKIYYTDGSGSDEPKINEIDKLSIDSLNDKNLKIYIGCDIKDDKKMPLDLEKEYYNTFTGYIGNIIILNSKKILKKNTQDIPRIFLSFKGDYDSNILMALGTNDNKSCLINNENKYNDNQIQNRIMEITENSSDFFESLKILISSESFKLIEYKDEIDYLNLCNNYDLYEELKKTSINARQNYLNLKQKKNNLKDKMINIFTSFFNCRFHIFENKRTLDEFMKYDGIHYLCLLFEYYYQIISMIENSNDINEHKENNSAINNINSVNSEDIYKKIENNIFDLINFFIDKILNKKYCKNFIIEINQFFYQMVITIKKYMKNNSIRNEIFDTIQILLIKFINLFKDEEKNIELTDYLFQLKNIRDNLLDLLYNLAFSVDVKNDKYKNIECYLNIMNYLLINDYLNDIFSEKFSKKLLTIYFLFDNSSPYFINKIEFLKLQKKYSILMIEFLKRVYKIMFNNKINEEKKEPMRKSGIFRRREKSIKEESNEHKITKNFIYLNHFFDKALEHLNHEYIFSNILTVIYQSELVELADFKYIEQIQNILENNCENINKVKKSQIICEASLKILSKYYLGNKEKEILLHSFLRGIPFYRGFFNCLISSLKQIKYITSDNKFIQKESEKNLLDLTENGNHSLKNIEINYGKEEQKELSNYNLYPFVELDFNNLDEKQNKIFIELLEDCISMLLKGENVITENDVNEIYESLIKNFDIVLKMHECKAYREIFSSEKAITCEFFFLIWKLSNKDKKQALIKTLKEYHKNLLRYHRYPFIYKFIHSVFFMEESENQDDNQELIIDLFCFIVDQLKTIEKENGNDKKNFNFFVINCVNLLILTNNLITKFDKLMENSLFYEGFFKLINFIENTGIIFSNYCFEISENIGKTIAEMCFDLLINLLIQSFNKTICDKFYKLFIIENKKEKEYLSVFYLTDLYKEDILTKEKLKPTFKKIVKNYDNLSYIQKNIFAKKKIYGKKPRQINNINYSIYFLDKTFLYLRSIKFDESEESGETDEFKELKKFLLNKFLIVLSDNIYKLWTKRISFYQHLICHHFPLYSYTKQFVESQVIQKPEFDNYLDFFKNDIPNKIKGENVKNCNASRFFDNREKEKDREDDEKEKNKEKKIWTMPKQNNFVKLPDINLDLMFKFEDLKKKTIIINPKNYLMKIIFSSSFENIFFNDNLFKKIRSSYLCKFRNNQSLNTQTKQLNYPTKQKNFSNSIEPKTFLRKDFDFYRKDFFSVSHDYIKANLIKDEEKTNLNFFPHNYYIDEIEIDKDINSLFECELITTQFLFFGEIKIGHKVICFKTKDDPRDKKNFNPKKLENKYLFSTKDNDNKTNKQKCIIIFIKDIKEVLRRRALLMNQAIEIFVNNGKSYFFNFFHAENCDKIFKIFEDRNKELKKEKQFILSSKEYNARHLSNILSQFKRGEISNYEYLLNLNKLSSRTYNDLTQYPIFPWLVFQIDELYKITSGEIGLNEYEKTYIRDMNYSVSMQDENKRIEELTKYNEEDENSFRSHLGTHYSTSSYIFYYLMRINPYGQNLIKLQNYKQENPNRMFLSFYETHKVLKSSSDNREMIPDLFCYIDYLCNVNCSFFGVRANLNIVDDFYIDEVIKKFDKNTNLISTFVECLYRQRKMLNNIIITKNLDKWVDIIFGKKQLPKNPTEAAKSCNIFGKYSYEQNINLENKLKKYKARYKDNEKEEKKLYNKLQNIINMIYNFGVCPIQILTETNSYDDNPNLNTNIILNSTKEGNYIYFTKINNNHYLSIKEFQNKDILPIRNINIYENKIKKEKYVFSSEYFEDDIPKIYMKNNLYSIPLYKINYSISHIIFIDELQNKQIFILTCRFLGNIFKVQNLEKTIMVSCEDFVTSIIARNSKENDTVFYTGLKNGKLTEWKIKIIQKLNEKKQKYEFSSFLIKEKKHIYAHKSSITAIEINNSKQIIATSGEDKYIRIRKLYDFEILTSIDLTYSFGNSVISENTNIFPSLIKISDLNCIYVLLYDYKSNITRIRGYTLNGLFFAQTDVQNLIYTNISFNKNWNIIAGVYNYNAVILLNSFNLKVQYQKRFLEENKTNKHIDVKWLEYVPTSKEFIILYNDECQIMTLKEEEQKLFDY